MNRLKVILISVRSWPLSTSLTNSAFTSNCTFCQLEKGGHVTISNAPRMTPHRTFEYHIFSYGPSSGSSTKSAKGFSSKTSEKDFSSAAHEVTVGVIFRYILNATFNQRIHRKLDLWNYVCSLSYITTSSSICFGQEILYQTYANIITPTR